MHQRQFGYERRHVGCKEFAPLGRDRRFFHTADVDPGGGRALGGRRRTACRLDAALIEDQLVSLGRLHQLVEVGVGFNRTFKCLVCCTLAQL